MLFKAFFYKEIFRFFTIKNSSPEIFERIFGGEIWEGFLVICVIFLIIGEKILGFSTTKKISQEVIEGISGDEISEGFLLVKTFPNLIKI